MMRFTKPDGLSFDLDYTGTIHVLDSGNDLIAICRGEEIIDGEEIISRPDNWDDWEIVIKVKEKEEVILQRAIASAWSSISLVERLTIKK